MLSNWTKATTTTTGTGTLTLAAVSGFPRPSDTFAVGEYVQYSLVTSDGNMESGIGTVAATNTLERTKVLSTYSSSTYNKLTATALTLASGTHDVFITQMAEMVFEPQHFPCTGHTNAVVNSTALTLSAANVAPFARERAIAYPFRLETSGLLTGMGVYCAVPGTASTTDLALYESGSDGKPGRRIAILSADLDTSSTGWKSQTVAANVRLIPGWYWVGLCVTAGSGTPSFSGSGAMKSAFGGAGVSGGLSFDYLYVNAASTLDDPFPAGSHVFAYNNNANWPAIGLTLS